MTAMFESLHDSSDNLLEAVCGVFEIDFSNIPAFEFTRAYRKISRSVVFDYDKWQQSASLPKQPHTLNARLVGYGAW